VRNVLSIIGLLIIIVIPLVGCSEIGSGDATVGIATKIAGLEAKSPIWDSYGPRLAAVEARPITAGSTFDSSALNNKDNDLQNQINNTKNDLQIKIDALTAKINNLTPSSTPGGSPTSPTGSVQFTNNPVSIPQIFSSSTGGSSSPWIMTIVNQSTTWQYVKPVINLNIASGQSQQPITDIIVMVSGGSCTMTGECLNGVVTGNYSFSPTTMNTTATPSVVIIPISGCTNAIGEINIGPGQSVAVNIQIQSLKTPQPVLWNVSTSISSRSM
jgi:hypothetical protein